MRKIWLAGIAGAAAGVAATQFTAPILAQEAEKERTVYEQLDLFGDIFERVRSSYVEEVSEKELIESAINGMLSHLDPHSSYLPPEDFDDMRVQTKGEFGGLGIEVTQEEGFVKVVAPIEGTPADRAGVQPGDLITHVNHESVLGLTLNEAVDLMRGPVGSEITITISRGEEEPFDVKINRETITISAVRSRLEDGVVVLRITTFNEQTFPNLEEQLQEQIEAAGGMDKVTGLVIDLRNNPGGLLNQAISVVDAFLDSGEIVSTRGRDPRDSERYNATPGDLAEGKPLVVVINGGSASASEIVAGALKDHRRAVVVGTQSFGKGSVQTIMPVQGEGAMRLTTARYYTPSGRSIQALGVSPDIIVEQRLPEDVTAEAEEQEQGQEEETGTPPLIRSEADLRGSLENDSLTEDEKKILEEDRLHKEETARLRAEDYQLSYAIDILRGLSYLGEEFRQRRAVTEAEILALPYRPCVGLVVVNPAGLIFAGQRIDSPGPAWQMPQGGIDVGETSRAAALRELREETGIPAEAVEVVAETPGWMTYDLPLELVPRLWKGRFRGQKQRWFLLRFAGDDALVNIATPHPEFSRWAWMAPEDIVASIVPFKRATYDQVFAAFRDRLG